MDSHTDNHTDNHIDNHTDNHIDNHNNHINNHNNHNNYINNHNNHNNYINNHNNHINNRNLKNIYIKFSNVLSGCRTIYDALFFAQFYIKNNPECKSMINGMIHGKHYEKVIDFRSVANILKILNDFETRNDIDNYIDENINKDNFDYSQLNSLLRLGRTKTYIKQNNSDMSEVTENINKNLVNLIHTSQISVDLSDIENNLN